MSNKPPAFQFYAKDFLSSPSVRTMSLAGLGAYWLLLASAWDSEPVATLPDDDEKLRKLAMASTEQWAAIRAEVMDNFEPFEDGLLTNTRLRQQYEELVAFSTKQSENGKKAKGVPKRKPTESQNEAKQSSATASSTAIKSNNINERAKPGSDGGVKSNYLSLRKQIIDSYPMKPFTPKVSDNWRLAIDVEMESIKSDSNQTPEQVAMILLDGVRAYAATKPEKPYALDKFLRDGHYAKDWARKPKAPEPSEDMAKVAAEWSVEDAARDELLEPGEFIGQDGQRYFHVSDVDDKDGLS